MFYSTRECIKEDTRNEKENVSLNVLVTKQTPHGSDGKEVNMGLLGPNYFRI